MNQRRAPTRRLVVLAVACLAAAAANAQISVTANGPYYATPSWSQKLTKNRFVVLADWNHEAVLDRETGLVWERSPDTVARAWNGALTHCIDRQVGDRKGWRMPGIQELSSLVDVSVPPPGPRLPAGHPFLGVQQSPYWTASTYTTTTLQLALDTVYGDTLSSSRSFPWYVWCVRGGQGHDAK
jgi:hypothetical protein